MADESCSTCEVDVDSEECQRCRNAKHKAKFRFNLQIYPTVTITRPTIKGSEDSFFDKKK
jgi:ferredoxin